MKKDRLACDMRAVFHARVSSLNLCVFAADAVEVVIIVIIVIAVVLLPFPRCTHALFLSPPQKNTTTPTSRFHCG